MYTYFDEWSASLRVLEVTVVVLVLVSKIKNPFVKNNLKLISVRYFIKKIVLIETVSDTCLIPIVFEK